MERHNRLRLICMGMYTYRTLQASATTRHDFEAPFTRERYAHRRLLLDVSVRQLRQDHSSKRQYQLEQQQLGPSARARDGERIAAKTKEHAKTPTPRLIKGDTSSRVLMLAAQTIKGCFYFSFGFSGRRDQRQMRRSTVIAVQIHRILESWYAVLSRDQAASFRLA